MGIAPYKTFTFDGVSSSAYGVYLTGEGVFNAPERDVEMVEVYGRNGDFALDHGRFKNITVTYKAGMFGTDESNFATKISNFRNWLCSKKGYCRLSDDYNPNEYRMAVYSAGLNVDHDFLIAGEFEIKFECKPQRWLTSGETATAVANNGTLTNPTLFDSSPLLAVKGYGTIGFNGYSLELINDVIGDTVIFNGSTSTFFVPNRVVDYKYITETIKTESLNIGDTFTISGCAVTGFKDNIGNFSYAAIKSITATNAHGETAILNTSQNPKTLSCSFVGDDITFTYGTSATSSTEKCVVDIWIDSQHTSSIPSSFGFYIKYDGNDTIEYWVPASHGGHTDTVTIPLISCYSTKTALGNPTYIDCDLGECYMESGDTIVSLNNAIQVGSDLPTLASGTNTFTYDNTVTELKVTPRWWQV